MSTTASSPRLTGAVAAWADRHATPGLGLSEALATLSDDWAAGPPETNAHHVRRLEAMSALTEVLRAATVQAALDATEAGLATKEVAASLGSTGATVAKWVKEARTA